VAVVVLDRVAEEIRERAAQLREELAERERVFREETQPLRDELARLDAALRAMEQEPRGQRSGVPAAPARVRAPRGQNRERILGVVGERAGVSAAEVAQVTGIAPGTVATTLAKLASAGEVVREQLPGGGVGFRPANGEVNGADGDAAE